MGIFSKSVTEAQAVIDTLTAERDAQIAKVTELTANLEAANTKAQDLEGKVTEAQGRITTLEGEKLKAEADLTQFKADFDAKVNALVIERCAAAGLSNPIASDPKATIEPKTMKRAEFEKLSFSARDAHIRDGGKLID